MKMNEKNHRDIYEWNQRLSYIKVGFLVWYSNIKIILRMIKLIFGLNNQLWKFPIFDCPQSSYTTNYQKILWGSSFGCKNQLNFICHIVKFHNCHHTNDHHKQMSKVSNSQYSIQSNLEIRNIFDSKQLGIIELFSLHQLIFLAKEGTTR